MTQENHDKAEKFLQTKYSYLNENSLFGWNEVVSVLAEVYQLEAEKCKCVPDKHEEIGQSQKWHCDKCNRLITSSNSEV